MTDLVDITAEDLSAALLAPYEPGHAVDLTGRRVTGPVALAGKTLGGFDLSGSVFEGSVTLDRAAFRGLTWLRDCTFRSTISAKGALVCHDARFDGSRFGGEISVSGAECLGQLVFDGATLDGVTHLDRLQVLGSLSFARTEFNDALHLDQTEALGGLWCDSAAFRGAVTAEGMEVHGRNWWRGAILPDATRPLYQQIKSYGYVWH